MGNFRAAKHVYDENWEDKNQFKARFSTSFREVEISLDLLEEGDSDEESSESN